MENRTIDENYNINSNNEMSRSSRNSKLYRQVYGKYQESDNLPLEDNTDEIDIDSLKQLLSRSEKPSRVHHSNTHDLEIIESLKREKEKEKTRDINKLLEKARYENKKIQEPNNDIINNSKNILKTLETGDYEGNYLKEEEKEIKSVTKKEVETPAPNNLEMTREMKFYNRNKAMNPLIDQVMPNNDLSLELLSDLKPNDNTIVTKPVKEKKEEVNKPEIKEEQKKPKIKEIKEEKKDDSGPFFPMNMEDTSDIDIIKKPEEIATEIKKVDNDFFTSSYEFSRKDFTDYDDGDEKRSNNIIKIILLVLAICVFSAVIAYFIFNYGIKK